VAPGRRTIAAMIAATDAVGARAYDAYHRFVGDGAWSMSGLWRTLASHAVARFAPTGVVALDCDETLYHKTGRHVDGAGVFRDAVRSTSCRVVFALGLNLVVITLRVRPPRGCPDRGSSPPTPRRTTPRPVDPPNYSLVRINTRHRQITNAMLDTLAYAT
jgi:hypothetical protein